MRALSIVGAAASVLVLVGCAAPVATPAPATDSDVEAAQQQILDATYDREGFDTERLTSASDLGEDHERGFGDCLEAEGVDISKGWGASIGPDGFALNGVDNAEVSAADQFIAYTCLARYPYDVTDSGWVYSASQREYLWDYYARWVVPCLRSHGQSLLVIPSKDEFLESSLVTWSPYDALDYTRAGGIAGFETLQEQCGPRLGMLEQ